MHTIMVSALFDLPGKEEWRELGVKAKNKTTREDTEMRQKHQQQNATKMAADVRSQTQRETKDVTDKIKEKKET